MGGLLGNADLLEHSIAELAERQLRVLVLAKALQPVVPRLGARVREEIVDDEELEIDGARELEVQVTRPVVRPLDLDSSRSACP